MGGCHAVGRGGGGPEDCERPLLCFYPSSAESSKPITFFPPNVPNQISCERREPLPVRLPSQPMPSISASTGGVSGGRIRTNSQVEAGDQWHRSKKDAQQNSAGHNKTDPGLNDPKIMAIARQYHEEKAARKKSR